MSLLFTSSTPGFVHLPDMYVHTTSDSRFPSQMTATARITLARRPPDDMITSKSAPGERLKATARG